MASEFAALYPDEEVPLDGFAIARKLLAEVARLREDRRQYGLDAGDAYTKLQGKMLEVEAERDRLRAAGREVVREFESHGGPGTHQECSEGACYLAGDVAALKATLGAKPLKGEKGGLK